MNEGYLISPMSLFSPQNRIFDSLTCLDTFDVENLADSPCSDTIPCNEEPDFGSVFPAVRASNSSPEKDGDGAGSLSVLYAVGGLMFSEKSLSLVTTSCILGRHFSESIKSHMASVIHCSAAGVVGRPGRSPVSTQYHIDGP